MAFLRDYQQEASNAAVEFFGRKGAKGGGLMVLPTGSGKSWIIADIASRLSSPLLIFCPSREILLQNHEKLEAVQMGISSLYSASVGKKLISRITLATIGSVHNHPSDFDVFKYVIIDECHLVNAKGGMYEEFLHRREDRVVVGLTATPYRLAQSFERMAILKFITRTRPRIFDRMLYFCQISDLLTRGYLAQLKYYDLTEIDLRNVISNSTGADYDERSLIAEYERSGFYDKLAYTTLRVLHPKSGIPRKGILVFTRFTKEADNLVQKLREAGVPAAIVTGETPKKERTQILTDFKSGKIKVVGNVGTLSVGFDFPALDTVILARPTKSLALYYQQVGRCIRPCEGKLGWVIDLAGNYKRFGAVSELKIGLEKEGTNRWAVFSRGLQLTNVSY